MYIWDISRDAWVNVRTTYARTAYMHGMGNQLLLAYLRLLWGDTERLTYID